MIYLHLGLPKTASTSIQKIVSINKASNSTFLKNIMKKNDNLENTLNYISNKIKNISGDIIISDEEFLGYDPGSWFSRINLITRYFSKNTKIILVIRDPEDYLNSTFNQYCIKQGNIYDYNNFVIHSDEYDPNKSNFKFNIDEFDYERIINLLKANFNNTVIFKYENINMYKILNEFNIKIKNQKTLNKKANVSFNKTSVLASIYFYYIMYYLFFFINIKPVFNIIKTFILIIINFLIFISNKNNSYELKTKKLRIKNLSRKKLYARIIGILINNFIWKYICYNLLNKIDKSKFKIIVDKNIIKELKFKYDEINVS